MKILAINGSPRTVRSNTHRLAQFVSKVPPMPAQKRK